MSTTTNRTYIHYAKYIMNMHDKQHALNAEIVNLRIRIIIIVENSILKELK